MLGSRSARQCLRRLFHFRWTRPFESHELSIPKLVRLTVEASYDAAAYDQQDARSGVPRMQAELPKSFESPQATDARSSPPIVRRTPCDVT